MKRLAHPETRTAKEISEDIRSQHMGDEAQTGSPIRKEGQDPSVIKASETEGDDLDDPHASEPVKKTPQEMKENPSKYYEDESESVDKEVVKEMGLPPSELPASGDSIKK